MVFMRGVAIIAVKSMAEVLAEFPSRVWSECAPERQLYCPLER